MKATHRMSVRVALVILSMAALILGTQSLILLDLEAAPVVNEMMGMIEGEPDLQTSEQSSAPEVIESELDMLDDLGDVITDNLLNTASFEEQNAPPERQGRRGNRNNTGNGRG